MQEFSAEGEVIAVKRAMRLVRARRRTSDETYGAAQDTIYAEINALDAVAAAAATADLLNALSRFGSVAAMLAATHSDGVFDEEQILEMIERSLMSASIEYDPDD